MHPSDAQFFDGLSAARHDVQVALSEDRQSIILTGSSLPGPLCWRLMDLRALAGTSDASRLTLTRHAATEDETPRDPARLVIHDPALIAWMHRTRPNLFKRDVRTGALRKLGLYFGGAVAAAALMLFVILPAMADTLARLIPVEREAAFGKTVTAQMERILGGSRLGDLRCDNPAGSAALQQMLARLTSDQDLTYDVGLQVFDHSMINAFAAPGGQVVILRGLLDSAGGPDEVAGVLAHELGHVEARDATRHALRAAGSAGLLTMILGDFTGGAAIAVMGEHMLSAAYSREAEALADDFALSLLRDAGISADGLAGFFDRMAGLQDGAPFSLPGYLATHPATSARAERARDVASEQSETRAILNRAEWRALKAICD